MLPAGAALVGATHAEQRAARGAPSPALPAAVGGAAEAAEPLEPAEPLAPDAAAAPPPEARSLRVDWGSRVLDIIKRHNSQSPIS